MAILSQRGAPTHERPHRPRSIRPMPECLVMARPSRLAGKRQCSVLFEPGTPARGLLAFRGRLPSTISLNTGGATLPPVSHGPRERLSSKPIRTPETTYVLTITNRIMAWNRGPTETPFQEGGHRCKMLMVCDELRSPREHLQVQHGAGRRNLSITVSKP